MAPGARGKPRRFCSAAHRRAFERTAKAVGAKLLGCLVDDFAGAPADDIEDRVTWLLDEAEAALDNARVCRARETPLA